MSFVKEKDSILSLDLILRRNTGGLWKRSSEIGAGTGTVCVNGRRAGIPFLSAQRHGSEKSSDRLLEKDSCEGTISGNFYSHDAEQTALGDIRTLGSLQRKYVHDSN